MMSSTRRRVIWTAALSLTLVSILAVMVANDVLGMGKRSRYLGLRIESRLRAERVLDAMSRGQWIRAMNQLSWCGNDNVVRAEGTTNRHVWGEEWELARTTSPRFGVGYPPDRIYSVLGRDGRIREIRFEYVQGGKINNTYIDGERAFMSYVAPAPPPDLPAEAPPQYGERE